jgi:hypothetical protein
MNPRDDIDRADARLDRPGIRPGDAAREAGEAARHTGEAMEAGASGTLERAQESLRDARRKAAHVADRIGDARPDLDLEERVDRGTENALHRAGDAIRGAAPGIGRGVETAVGAAGSAVSAVGGPLATVMGKIAGRVGGWWSSASDAVAEMGAEEERACRLHFESHTARPVGMTFDRARPGYVLGLAASRNPAYRDRPFEEIEPDLRHGFGAEPARDYDELRDFTRFGYERAAVVRTSPPGAPVAND